MLLQHRLLMRVHLNIRAHPVPPVRMLRHHPQQIPLPAAPDHDRRHNFRFRLAITVLQLVMLAREVDRRIRPHRPQNPDRLRQLLDASPCPGKRPAVPPVLLLIPARADPDHHPPAGKRLRRRRHLRQVRRVAKTVAQHIVAHQLVRVARQRVHRHRPALGHIVPVVLHVIRKPQRIKWMDDLIEIGEKFRYVAGPRVDAYGDAHTCLLRDGARRACAAPNAPWVSK